MKIFKRLFRSLNSVNKNFYEALEQGNLIDVNRLVEKDHNMVNAKFDYGLFPLLIASCGGYQDIVEVLLDNGADVKDIYVGLTVSSET